MCWQQQASSLPTVLLPPPPPPRDPRLQQGLGGQLTHVPWQPPLPEEPYPHSGFTQSGSEAEEIPPPLPPGSPPPTSIRAIAPGQSSLPAGPHTAITESSVLAEEAPPKPPPGSPPPSVVQVLCRTHTLLTCIFVRINSLLMCCSLSIYTISA